MFFPVRDVERLIFDLLDPVSLCNLAQVNRYCSIKVQETSWRQDLKKLIECPAKFEFGYARINCEGSHYAKCSLFETACSQANFRIARACFSSRIVRRIYSDSYYFIRKMYQETNESVYQWLVIYIFRPKYLPYLIERLKEGGPEELLPWTEQYYAQLPK